MKPLVWHRSPEPEPATFDSYYGTDNGVKVGVAARLHPELPEWAWWTLFPVRGRTAGRTGSLPDAQAELERAYHRRQK